MNDNGHLVPVEQNEGATRTVFKYMSFDAGMDCIINSWLRISRLHSLNDPFEWRVRDEIGENQEQNALFNKVFHQFDARCGILCFSAVPDSTLMWAHYADSHRGIVLELEVEGLQQVNYLGPPTIEEVEGSLRNTVWGLTSNGSMFYLRKRREWSYEKELRKVCLLQRGIGHRTPGVEGHHEKHFTARLFGNTITILGTEKSSELHYYWRFKKSSLKSVRFGEKCSEERREALSHQLRKLKYEMVKCFKMKLSKHNGKMIATETSYA